MIGPINLSRCSIANLTVSGGDPVALIEAAASAGFGAVGLVTRSAMARKALSHPIIGNPKLINDIKAALRATGVKVFDTECFLLSDTETLEDYRPSLEIAAELDATHISSIGKELAGHDSFLTENQRVDLFGRLCEAAAEFGLTVGVEFMRYRDISTLGDALGLIDKAGKANSGVIFDALHFHRTGGIVEQLKAVPPEKLAYAQLCDAGPQVPSLEHLPIEARTNRLHLGQGVIDLKSIVAALPQDVQLVVEIPVAADARLSLPEKVSSVAKHSKAFFDSLS